MVASVVTVGGALLKRVYDDTINDMINSRDDVMGLMPKDYSSDGQEFYKIHRTAGSPSMGFQAETDTLPTPSSQTWKNSVITPMEWWGTLSLTQKLISLSKTQPGAFMRGFDAEVYGFSRDVRKFFEVRIMGDGSGTLATSNEAPANAQADLVLKYQSDVRRLVVGQELEIWAVREPTVTALRVTTGGIPIISAINPSTKTITLSANFAANTVADFDVITQRLSRTLTGRQTMQGIDGAVYDGSSPMETVNTAFTGTGFQAIKSSLDWDGTAASSPNPTWSSPTFRNGAVGTGDKLESGAATVGTNRPITPRLLQQAMDAVEIGGNGQVDTYVCPYGVRLDYAISQLNIRRNVNTAAIAGQTTGGFTEDIKDQRYVQYANQRIIPNRFCRENVVYAMSWDRQMLKFWAKPQWWDDGNILRRSPASKTEYQAEMFAFLEYGVEERNAHARLMNIDDVEIATV